VAPWSEPATREGDPHESVRRPGCHRVAPFDDRLRSRRDDRQPGNLWGKHRRQGHLRDSQHRNIPAEADATLFDESGTPLTLSSQSCNGSSQPVGSPCNIAPGGIFFIRADVAHGFAYTCSASGSTRNLRGAI